MFVRQCEQLTSVMHHAPSTLQVAPFSLLYFYHPHLCTYIVECLICFIIYQCLGMLLWSTEILRESLRLLFGAAFSVVDCHIMRLLALC